MREANWDEIFQKRHDDAPSRDAPLSSFVPWEAWLTFLITACVFMSVVASIDSAGWVDDMPSLYPIGFSALIIGYALSRVRVNALLLHPVGLLAGAALVLLQLIAIIPGSSPAVRVDHLVDRMYVWWSEATQSGISSDTLPFIVLVLVVTWLGTYVSSWAIFRWRNPWLGLVPGGTALMWNISFIPGQFSPAFIVFVFGAVLLIMRLHVARKEQEWDDAGIVYPEFISLSVLNVSFWVTVGILAFVWMLPLADRSDTAHQRWNDFTSPYVQRLQPLARVFVSVNAKKPITVHNLRDTLAFQGKIALSDRDAVEIDVQITPEVAAFLRAQSFDEYTAEGWKLNIESDVPLAAGDRADAPEPAVPDTRKEITINVKVQGGNNGVLYSLGQPVQADHNAEVRAGADPADVSSLKPEDHLRNGAEYQVTGSVSVASIEQLKAAGDEYPAWVTDRYLSLPENLPFRVRRKAREVTRGAGTTPYDKVAAIETYVRSFPVTYDVPVTPPGRDTVDYFLFDLQTGYFDYHASAMAVMLRSLGIPARVATGYAVDPQQREGGSDTFKLTERNAFSWPEVYFPGIGWVEFSPTPSEPLIFRPGTVAPPANKPDIPDPNIRGEQPIDLGIEPGADAPAPVAERPADGSSLLPVLALLGAAAGVLALVGGAGRFAWEYGLGGMPRPAQLWEKTRRLATLGKAGPHPNETPREFATRLGRDVPGTNAARYIAVAYERSRFGHKSLSEDEAGGLEAAWPSLRGALLRRALRLKPRG
ncbi:MAG: transglutaminase domain-containing protein [Chloroflexi bacterium]|nr:transglutaminase domain-containing protein [Chloroflexota bacterium]